MTLCTYPSIFFQHKTALVLDRDGVIVLYFIVPLLSSTLDLGS